MKRRGGARIRGWRDRARRAAIAAIEDMVATGCAWMWNQRLERRGGVGESTSDDVARSREMMSQGRSWAISFGARRELNRWICLLFNRVDSRYDGLSLVGDVIGLLSSCHCFSGAVDTRGGCAPPFFFVFPDQGLDQGSGRPPDFKTSEGSMRNVPPGLNTNYPLQSSRWFDQSLLTSRYHWVVVVLLPRRLARWYSVDSW